VLNRRRASSELMSIARGYLVPGMAAQPGTDGRMGLVYQSAGPEPVADTWVPSQENATIAPSGL
jgi:hypothetical protein